MKKSIEWHRECLENRQNSLLRKKDLLKLTIDSLNTQIKNDAKYIDFYTIQIEEARNRGKDSFDRDRYLKALKRDKT